MNLLAIDTAASLCAACVFDTEAGRELGREVLDLGKGHAEHLIGVIEAALASSGTGYADIGMIAVSVGPGSFTGVRVGVSAARGLALALKVPAVGVTTLEALAAEARFSFPDRDIMTVIDAGRGGLYVAVHGADGHEIAPAALLTVEQAVDQARETDPVLVGSGVAAVRASGRQGAEGSLAATADILAFARLAAERGLPGRPATPLYLRAADAKPQADFALPRKVQP